MSENNITPELSPDEQARFRALNPLPDQPAVIKEGEELVVGVAKLTPEAEKRLEGAQAGELRVPEVLDDDDIASPYLRTREDSEEQDAIDQLDDEFGEEQRLADVEKFVDLGSLAKEAAEATGGKPRSALEEAQAGAAVEAGDVISDVVTRGIPSGAREALVQTGIAADSLALWLNEHVLDLRFDETSDTAFRDVAEELPEASDPATAAGQMSAGITQFFVGFVGPGAMVKVARIKGATKGGQMMKFGLRGAIADAVARDPNEENLANMLKAFPAAQRDAVVQFMQSDPNDSGGRARLKKGLEGFLLGWMIDGTVLIASAYRAARAARTAVQEAATAAEGGAAALVAAPVAADRPDREGEVETASLLGPIIKGLVKGGKRKTPVFFSNAAKAIDGARIEKGTADQWLALPGLKKEELEASGLPEFLRSQDGSVTKAEVLDHLDQNGVRLEETVKGGNANEGMFEVFDPQTGEVRHVVETEAEAARLADAPDPQGAVLDFARVGEDTLGEQLPDSVGTKFSTYTLPGGENYKETLIRLPEIDTGGTAARRAEIEAELQRPLVDTPIGRAEFERRAELTAEFARLRTGDNFTGGHFNEPNVLVHIRHNERTTADGGRTLFIEEIQSDWHQKGRTQGYKTPASQELLARAQKEFDAWLVQNPTTDPAVWRAANPELSAAVRDSGAVSGVPDAPFKKTWHELGLKRMIREAAEKGFDSISWTTGRQQAERYDLSKHIDEITVTPRTDAATGDRSRSVFVKLPDDRALTIGVDEKGIVDNTGASNVEMNGKPLEEVLGKEMADKIMQASAQTVFKDVDLRVGGEGMKSFYDRMLPQAANRLGKKFGAKVETVKIPGQPGDDGFDLIDSIANDSGMTVRTLTAEIRSGRATQSMLGLTDEQFQSVRIAARGGQETVTVHVLPITPELKKEVLDNGLPLFSAAGAAGLAVDKINIDIPGILLEPPFVAPEEPRTQ